jgi:hypothetical protein
LRVAHSAASAIAQIRVEVATLVLQLEAGDRQRRDSGHAGVPTEHFQIAEHVEEADAPGDRGQRQIVAAHAQRNEPEEQGERRREDETDREREPGRCGVPRRKIRGRIGADADERRLAE